MTPTQALAKRTIGSQSGFRWRGEEITRIEGLSDAVFAFAVTLLIVSLEVPKTFTDLLVSLRGFVAFAACFTLLMFVWYQHYIFCRRYGLQDAYSIFLTMVLLFIVLFYTYPLKFLFTTWLAPSKTIVAIANYEQLSQLFSIYALGYIAVFGVFTLMYLRAFKQREVLELTPLECWETRHSIREMVLNILLGLCSLVIANVLQGESIPLAGMVYALAGPTFWLHGKWSNKKRETIFGSLA